MPRFTSPHDSASLFYRDYIPDPQSHDTDTTAPETSNTDTTTPHHKPPPTLVFLHGWPMSSRMFEHLLVPLCQDHNLRCVAPDRRGFGASDWNGRCGDDIARRRITYDTFADDVAFLLEDLAVGDFVFVGASMGSGESLLAWERSDYVRQHCKGFIWLGPNLPFPIQSASNPTAPSLALWHSITASMRDSRPPFVAASLPGIFGIPSGAVVPAKTLEHYERIVEAADALAVERTSQILLRRDFTPEVRRLGDLGEGGVRLLLLHGDADVGMPFEASSGVVKGLVPRAVVRVYEKAGHGLYLTHAEQVLRDILKFVEAV